MASSFPSGTRITQDTLMLMPVTRSLGAALNGQEQIVMGPDSLWACQQTRIVPEAAFVAWQAFIDGLDGPVGAITLVPGTDTLRGTQYATPPGGSPVVAVAAAAGQDELRITHDSNAEKWLAGQMFCLNSTCHRIVSAAQVDFDTADLVLRPRLRSAAAVSDALVAPYITMRLVNAEDAAIVYTPGAYAEVTLQLVEFTG